MARIPLIALIIFSGALLNGCGGDDKQVAVDPIGKVDTAQYKNTTDAAGLQSKGIEAQKIFSSADEKFSSVAGNKFVPLKLMQSSNQQEYDEEKCKLVRKLTETETENDALISTFSCEYTDADDEKVVCTIVETLSTEMRKTQVSCDNGFENIDTIDTENGADTEKSSSTESSSGFDYSVLTDFSEGTDDCNAAIANVKEFYASAKSELETMLEGVKDKNSISNQGGGKIIVEEIADANAAVAYKFSTDPSVKGMTATGSMTAGASEDVVVMSFNIDMAMDLGAILGDLESANKLDSDPPAPFAADQAKPMKMTMVASHKVEADLKAQAIDYSDSGVQTMNDTKFSWNSMISVQGGEKPAVTVDMTVSGTPPSSDSEPAKDVSSKMQINITMIDDNTIEMTGSGVMDQKAHAIKRTVTRSAEGKCTVTNDAL